MGRKQRKTSEPMAAPTRKQRAADKAHRDGKSRREPPKPTKSILWTRSAATVDPRAEVYGRRKRTRTRTTAWAGAMVRAERAGLRYQFGEGLAEHGRALIVVDGVPAGRLDDVSAALGYVKAAKRAGHDAEMFLD